MAENDLSPQSPTNNTEQAESTAGPTGNSVSPAIAPTPEHLAPESNELGWTARAEASAQEAVTWTASEFIVHHKSSAWYAGLAAAAALIAASVWFLTRDGISAAVVVFGAVMLGIYAGRQPRQLEYKLDGSGLTIGQKHYPYDGFRSFSVIDEGAFSSIMFMPLKRFAPAVSIYYAPEDETAIADLLSARLPSEDRGRDPIDRLMHRIRF